jgi:dTDP-4-dehydrorhamnose reductase
MKRILLTGTSGQVGGALRSALWRQAEILAPQRRELDLSELSTIAPVLDRMQPDLIINAAAYTAVDRAEDEAERAFRVNAEAPSMIALWAAARTVPLIHFSTDYVFNGRGERPWREDDSCDPLSVYGKSKLAGESGIREAGGMHLIIRTSWVYASSGTNFLRTIIRLAKERPELRVVADQIGAPTSARSIADAVQKIALMETNELANVFSKAKGLVHLTNSGFTSWHGFASGILDQLKRHPMELRADVVIPIETKDFPTKAVRPLNSRLDLSRLRDNFRLKTCSWQQALVAEIQHFFAQ